MATIIDRINALSNDMDLHNKLIKVLNDHDAELQRRRTVEVFVETLLNERTDNKYFNALSQFMNKKELTYSRDEIVPSEFQDLEDYALVSCHYGSRDHRGLMSRTIVLTHKGNGVCEAIAAHSINKKNSTRPS